MSLLALLLYRVRGETAYTLRGRGRDANTQYEWEGTQMEESNTIWCAMEESRGECTLGSFGHFTASKILTVAYMQ